jgi:chemotaxis protein MotB
MLNMLQEELQVKEAALAEREESINRLNAQLDLQRQSLQSLKAGLNDALRGFSASDLTVVERDGKIYVSMSQNLLFASGSNKLDQKGKDALVKVAGVLAKTLDFEILVEGHTDTDGTADFNWDLSVSRATAVVKELTSHGVEPKRITAAGRGFYVPVDSNESAEGKAKNRRTEIILSPKLDQLYRLLN